MHLIFSQVVEGPLVPTAPLAPSHSDRHPAERDDLSALEWLPDPPPFVLETSLNDFHISYELNAYTDRANDFQNIYSRLHEAIQDSFNQAGGRDYVANVLRSPGREHGDDSGECSPGRLRASCVPGEGRERTVGVGCCVRGMAYWRRRLIAKS